MIALVVITVLVILVVLLLLASGVRLVQQYEQGVVLRFGRLLPTIRRQLLARCAQTKIKRAR
jgi:regulator of protease activity HflC (stomatin/prohibitin superfamily)